MVRDCDTCGGRYTAKRATSKYCSPRCRQRASRAPKKPAGLSAVPPLTPEQRAALSRLENVTLEALAAAGRDQTVLGQMALMLARRLDEPTTDTGSSIAALVREHRVVMAAALEGTQREETPLDKLRRARELRIGGA